MEKKAYIYINYNNIVVLKSYLDVIKKALENNGYQCVYVKSLEGIDTKALILHPMGVDAFKFYWKGYKNFILWQQGTTADESFMRNHSKLRYKLINMMDVFAMKKAKYILFVSDYMREHFEQLAGRSFVEKSYLMPCFNEEFDNTIFAEKDYCKRTFSYVGSLDLWQCFDKTADLYKNIENAVPNTLFKVLTFNIDEAKRILDEKGVKNYSLKCVPKEQVKGELIETTYGFILRDDNIVNRVATPTKFSSYLSAGVIPIFSDCLRDFSLVSKDMKYVLKLGGKFDIEEVVEFVNKDIDAAALQKEYKTLFENYYSLERHVENLTQRLSKIGSIKTLSKRCQ